MDHDSPWFLQSRESRDEASTLPKGATTVCGYPVTQTPDISHPDLTHSMDDARHMRGPMATCPSCGIHGYENDGTFRLDTVLWAEPIGSFSLSGAQMKVAAYERQRLSCNACGWYVLGIVGEREFLGDLSTQHWPDQEAPQ